MKKLYLIFIISIFTINITHAQSDWITYKIDKKLSVKLPTQPTNINGGVVAHTKDSLICFVNIIGETDSISLAKMALTDNFANGLKSAMAENQKGLVLGDIKTSKWNGYYCYNVDGINTSSKLKVSFYFLIIGGRIYAFGAMIPDNHNINEKNIFFNSLTLN